MPYKIYASNKNEWEKACAENFHKEGEIGVRYVENAIIEPLIPYKEDYINMYKGGVCDDKYKFLAGLIRREGQQNFAYTNRYSYSEVAVEEQIDEDTIFGGEIIDAFGHVLTETLCRCWFLLQENVPKKILFTTITSKVPGAFYEFLRLLGIKKEQIIVVSKVTQVKSILIPDQSLILFSWYMDRWIDVYCCMRDNAFKELKQAVYPDKLYLTRSQLMKRDCIGEEYFEEFYRKRGYEIVAPEKLSLVEQIGLIYNAKEIVCTVGTLSHMILFAKEETHLTLLLRNNEIGAVRPQILINQAKKINYNIIDVTMNILPTSHANGVFYIGPTKHWLSYLKENNISYSEKEGQFDYSRLYEYLCVYAREYQPNCYRYGRVKEKDITDVIVQMKNVLLDKPTSRTEYKMPSISELKKQLSDEKNILDEVVKGSKIFLPGALRTIDLQDQNRIFNKKFKWVKNIFKSRKKNPLETYKLLQIRYSSEKTVIDDKEYLREDLEKQFDTKEGFIPTLLLSQKLIGTTDLVCFLTEKESIPFEEDDYKRFLISGVHIGVFHEVKFKKTVEAQYVECHGEKSWKIMFEGIEKYYQIDLDAIKEYFYQNVFVEKHCFVTKSTIFHDYIEWVIPILNYTASHITRQEAGLIYKTAERLFGAFLWIHKVEYKIGFFYRV